MEVEDGEGLDVINIEVDFLDCCVVGFIVGCEDDEEYDDCERFIERER